MLVNLTSLYRTSQIAHDLGTPLHSNNLALKVLMVDFPALPPLSLYTCKAPATRTNLSYLPQAMATRVCLFQADPRMEEFAESTDVLRATVNQMIQMRSMMLNEAKMQLGQELEV